MPRISIQDCNDPRLAPYRELPLNKALRPAGLFIAEGRLLIERLLASRFEVQSIFVDESHADEVAALAGDSIPLYVAPRKLLEETIGFNFHRGMLACGRRGMEPTLETVLRERERRAALTVVVCVNVYDPENLGGILRNCAAFGVDAVIVSRQSVDPLARRVLRVSMGASFKLPIVTVDDTPRTLDELRTKWNTPSAATVLDNSAESLLEFARPSRLAVVFGNEGHGLPDDVISACDHRLTIPMRLGTDSLNVSVACGILLHELIVST
jgi:tRNA G18 (ribose-2'-O)-methylase SpoU